MTKNKDLLKIFDGKNLGKMSKYELINLNSKLDLYNIETQRIILEELDTQDFIMQKQHEILSIINEKFY